jgi:hypothetical protein
MDAAQARRHRGQWLLLAATALCYLIGYPLALILHSDIGWIFVSLGGPLLIALGVVTVRRIHRSEPAGRLAEGEGL